jgi:hypothetical protein
MFLLGKVKCVYRTETLSGLRHYMCRTHNDNYFHLVAKQKGYIFDPWFQPLKPMIMNERAFVERPKTVIFGAE